MGRLKRMGWKVMNVWEHQLKVDKKKALQKIKKFLMQHD